MGRSKEITVINELQWVPAVTDQDKANADWLTNLLRSKFMTGRREAIKKPRWN